MLLFALSMPAGFMVNSSLFSAFLHNYGKTMTKEVIIRQYQDADLPQMTSLWNEVVAVGNAFPRRSSLA